jgi:hypothetical protein
MPESELHQELVISLVSRIAEGHGEVTHAVNSGTLSDPPKIGRHEPDVLATGLGGTQVIGEAKTGPDLFESHSLEQFEDFTHHEVEGETAALVVMVPRGFEEDARSALEEAGAAMDRTTIITVALPPRQSTKL